MYLTDQRIMQNGDPIELDLEVLEIQKRNLQMDRAPREDWEKWNHLPSYHVYSQGYDNQNVQNGYWWQ